MASLNQHNQHNQLNQHNHRHKMTDADVRVCECSRHSGGDSDRCGSSLSLCRCRSRESTRTSGSV